MKLIVTDENSVLLKAIRSLCPFTKAQRCIAHKLHNVAVKIRKVNRPYSLKEAKGIFASKNRKEALRRFRGWESKWRI